MSAAPFLPYGRQCIEDDDVAAVANALRSDFLTTGPRIEQFEATLAAKVSAHHAVVCANATAALYMAARALAIAPGDKVIVPAITFLATATAPHLCGAEIVFADVDPTSGLMRPQDLEDALGRAGTAAALFNVHLAGQCEDLETIHAIARHHGLRIVDDACHAIGADHIAADGSRHPIGANRFSDISIFSFHAVKTITMGEGGAATTEDPALAEAMARIRNHGMTRAPGDFVHRSAAFGADGTANPWYYELTTPSLNFRATDFQCALGQSQLGKLDRFVERRRELAAQYDRLLAPLAPRLIPLARTRHCDPAWHLYVAQIDFVALAIERAAFMQDLRSDGIGSQVHYIPLHRQPYFAQQWQAHALAGADAYYARALSLPLFPTMEDTDVERVAASLRRLVGCA